MTKHVFSLLFILFFLVGLSSGALGDSGNAIQEDAVIEGIILQSIWIENFDNHQTAWTELEGENDNQAFLGTAGEMRSASSTFTIHANTKVQARMEIIRPISLDVSEEEEQVEIQTQLKVRRESESDVYFGQIIYYPSHWEESGYFSGVDSFTFQLNQPGFEHYVWVVEGILGEAYDQPAGAYKGIIRITVEAIE